MLASKDIKIHVESNVSYNLMHRNNNFPNKSILSYLVTVAISSLKLGSNWR